MFYFEDPNYTPAWSFNIDDVLSDDDICVIDEYVNNHQFLIQKSKINTKESVDGLDQEYRSTDIMWLTNSSELLPCYNKLMVKALEANNYHFKFNLTSMEPPQYSIYDSKKQGHYDIHIDNVLRDTRGTNRKLTSVTLMNDAGEFEGGKLLLHYSKHPYEIELKKGRMVLFPSYLPHSVTPVTDGVRKTLVTWFHGPNFV